MLSKAVVLVLVLCVCVCVCVCVCGFVVFTRGRFMLSCHALCLFVFFFFFFSVLSALCSPRLGKRELLLVHLFVYFAHVESCPFCLPLRIRVWLQLLIVEPLVFYIVYRFNYCYMCLLKILIREKVNCMFFATHIIEI